MWLPILRAPGADDDGSGTVTILEAFRALLGSADLVRGKADNTLEFHWYSAEEAGLLGSQAIFSTYEKVGADVRAMLQQDMTGYIQGMLDAGQPESMGVITDYVHPGLTAFIKEVITEVSAPPPSSWEDTRDLKRAFCRSSTVTSPSPRRSAVTRAQTMHRPARRATRRHSSLRAPSSTQTKKSTPKTTLWSTCRLTT